MVTETFQEKETYELGRRLGEEARAGQVYTLIGDLGVGKTVFTKGLAAGLGITEPVSSPTFTIVQEYEEGRLPFYHFDVYRIGDVEEMDEIGYEDYFFFKLMNIRPLPKASYCFTISEESLNTVTDSISSTFILFMSLTFLPSTT